MTKEQFLEKLTDILDYEGEIICDMRLSEIEEWDSLSYISFLAYSKTIGKDINIALVKNAETVQDLYNLIK